ncbi:MAG: polysaccharide deacetylase family protein [Acutalibacteraceae bacterium]
MNLRRKLRSRLAAVGAALGLPRMGGTQSCRVLRPGAGGRRHADLGAIMQAAAPVRPAGEPAGVPQPRTVYLTFDDGPSRNTEAMLSVLREEEVPATFFVTLADWDDYSDAYAAMVRKGQPGGAALFPARL